MCIAIVKPVGISIPEEHLKNGWMINDDGAGFACIDHEGKFLIHKSMTYEGFIDIYRQAIEAYGDTSDFLIHFRITSKGDTNLSNCHPFQVDDDRVIIHNGTLWNIHIDKDDPRSDTKVFAEDWLSELPEDWEDYPVIRAMLEDFIGSSKICMLHRTKGIYIFNKEKGVFENGIWYSNNTYKPISKAKIYDTVFYDDWNNQSKSFYSFKWGRLLSEQEVKYMSEKEKDEHRNFGKSHSHTASPGRWVKCDSCDEYDSPINMIKMDADHPNELWCYDCFNQSTCCDCCGIRYNEKDLDEYFNPDTDDTMVLCDKCVPYVNPMTIEKVETETEEEPKKEVAN